MQHIDDLQIYLLIKLKKFKRFLIKEGEMIKTFRHITALFYKKDIDAIFEQREHLLRNAPTNPNMHNPKYHKYYELIWYSEFLIAYNDNKNAKYRIKIANELLKNLNRWHELGLAIENQVIALIPTCT